MEPSVLQKEQTILSVCYEANKQLSKLLESKNQDRQNTEGYFWSFKSLMESCQFEFDQQFNPLYESKIQNTNGNYYAYFKKVVNFLDNYEQGIQKNLNESVTDEFTKKFTINSFRQELQNIISQLEKQDELNTGVNQKILRIKAALGKPIYVHGMNIINNVQFMQLLKEKYNISTSTNLLSLIYNISNKIIYVVCIDGNVVSYDIDNDSFEQFFLQEMTKDNYQEKIKSHTGINNIIELFTNVFALGLHYTDNLYDDNKMTQYFREQFENRNKVVR